MGEGLPSSRWELGAGEGEDRHCLTFQFVCFFSLLGGFAFLPFLWLVNIFWFFREAFLVPAYTEQSQIKGCESRAQMKGSHQVLEGNDGGSRILVLWERREAQRLGWGETREQVEANFIHSCSLL